MLYTYRPLRINSTYQLADGVMGIELTSVNGINLPPVQAGAHLRLRFNNDYIRQYSIYSAPDDLKHYRIAVKRLDNGRGGSIFLHEHAAKNKSINCAGPINNFSLDLTQSHFYFVAAGIGITPIYAMVWECWKHNVKFHLSYIGHSVKTSPFCDTLTNAPFASNIELIIGRSHEYIKSAISREIAASPLGTHLYYCVPPSLSEFIKGSTKDWPTQQIHTEQFEASEEGIEAIINSRQDGTSFWVRLKRSGVRLWVQAPDTIVKTLRSHGYAVDTSCENGYCGTCMTRYLGGAVQHYDTVLDDSDRKEYAMICCARARKEGDEILLDL